MSETFYILHEEKIISSALAEKMARMAGFRNIIAHDYEKLALFPGGEGWVISGAFGALNGIKGSSPHSQAFLDISSSRDLYFLTMVGWKNRHKEAHSATTAEKETLIFSA